MFSICQIRLKIYALTQNKILALFVEIWKFVTVFLCICSYGFMLKTCLHKRLSLDNISKTVKWWTGITNQQVDKKHIYIYIQRCQLLETKCRWSSKYPLYATTHCIHLFFLISAQLATILSPVSAFFSIKMSEKENEGRHFGNVLKPVCLRGFFTRSVFPI